MNSEFLVEAIRYLPLRNREALYGMANSPSAVSKIFLRSVDNFSFVHGRTLVTLCSSGGGIDLIIGNKLCSFRWEDVSAVLKKMRKDGVLLLEEEKTEMMEKAKRQLFCESAKMILGAKYAEYEDVFNLYLMGNFRPWNELPDGSHDVKAFLNNLFADHQLKIA